ncbi:unnamed protein product [Plutella xylostella]|uniref:(diamondback moth) hypothetical protein n=1 Tax=Plutella xylostella TaxID=51655 RepID=A0A8S4F7C0_PLUXY|nr:unnamed protein product [Plutella xylostella]
MENSVKGTRVLDRQGEPVRLSVSDPDLGPGDIIPEYTYELTTNYFDIDSEGFLVVNDEKLDRDPPNPDKFRFQVVAREANGGAASAPLSLAVQLLDENDNAPVIRKTQPVTVSASLDPAPVYKVEAVDIDAGDNARVTYSIYHVSNNGGNKFTIDPQTGVISSTGRLQAGEQYSVTVTVKDAGGLSSTGIIELAVAPGPNTRPPVFSARDYHAQVSEGAAINSTVVAVTAKDPENEAVSYAIVSGNDLRQFGIGSTTGIITVIRKLDREVLTRYQLMIKAEDPGKLASTATVNIKVTDINDNNPEFERDSYLFNVKEGLTGEFVGYVHASDADEGVNAQLSYNVPAHLPFSVDNVTGMISTNSELDYENIKEYAFVVTATDGAPDKRLGTASVTVQVLDVSDETPRFSKTLYSVHVPENANNYPVVKVEAEDPDTIPEITYTILRGDTELFSIDRKSGMIRTNLPLDRETTARHEIIVGTEENNGNDDGDTTMVEVIVDDKNDNSPIFTSAIRPITVEDSSSIGSHVETVIATDADATAPNNRIRYKLVGRGKASKYFHVEPDTGALRVRDDLRKEADSEYTVDVQAYDQGEPVMSSVTSLTVYVSHSATVPPDVGLGFADTDYTEHVAENSPNGTLVRILPLLNKRAHSKDTPLKCRLTDSSQQGVFYVILNDDRDCAIYLNSSSLDYEAVNEYYLEVQLESIKGLINPDSSKANIKVHVTDVNDNAPYFVFPDQSSIAAAKGKYFGIVTKDMLLGTNVLQVKAKDKDSSDFGKIEYQKNSWTKITEEYFSLDPDTGIISNIKTLENVPSGILPFKFSVTARDNPNSASDYNVARAAVVINLLQKDNQLVLEIADMNPDLVRRQSRSILSAIEDKTGLVAGVEKLTSRHFIGENGTLEKDDKGTDVWWFLVDPNTGEILTRESKKVKKAIDTGIRKSIAAQLQSPVSEVRPPLTTPTPPRVTHAAAPLASALPAALLALAALVLVAASAATVYICASWNRYKRHKQQELRQYGTLSASLPPRPPSAYESEDNDPAPRYETQIQAPQTARDAPVRHSEREPPAAPALRLRVGGQRPRAQIRDTGTYTPSTHRYKRHKQQEMRQYGTLSASLPPRPPSAYESEDNDPAPRYETQVLNMAVVDNDLQLDFSPNNHAFNIHAVQYLTKENGERSPTLSETATTARASSVNENTLNNSHDKTYNTIDISRNTQTLNRRAHPHANMNNHLNNALGTLPRANNNVNNGGLLAATLGRKIGANNNNNKRKSQPIMAYDEIPGLQRASENDNVTFGKRNFVAFDHYDQSPVETTTEL